jgi:DNA polymerase III delta prime subunit
MGKKKELQAKLTEADAALHHLESTRAALSEELRAEREELGAERERHAERSAALRRGHEEALEEIRRSTQEEMRRAGEHLAAARAALEKATEENSRLTADLRDRDDRARVLLQELEGGVEAALGQLSGALTRIRDAASHEDDRYRPLEHTQGP